MFLITGFKKRSAGLSRSL